MPSALLDLVNVLLRDIADNEGFARELGELGAQFEAEGDTTTARGMRDLGLRHRVRAIEERAQISALVERCRHLSKDDRNFS